MFKFPHDFEWGMLGVIISGVVVKLMTSQRLTLWSGTVAVTTAVFCAYVFTDPVAYYLGVTDNKMRYAVAGLLVLTGDGIVRFIIDITSDKESTKGFLVELIKAWRGHKK